MRGHRVLMKASLWFALGILILGEGAVAINARLHDSGPNVVGMMFWAVIAFAIAFGGALLSIALANRSSRKKLDR